MKIGVSIWNGRVSPVFDVAGRLVLLDISDGGVTRREEVSLSREGMGKVEELVGLGVEVLICGAISQSLAMMVGRSGIRVMSNICGPVEDVAGAFIEERLEGPYFLMPGCCGRRRRYRGCYRDWRGKEG
jgi:predicted Fe-Mo cluster-binding NifX family protein